MQMIKLEIQTRQQCQVIDVTQQVREAVDQSDCSDGMVVIFVPHTTAGVTINENADPDVVHDVLAQLDRMVPHTQPFYQHAEGNSAAHVKTSLTGNSQMILIHDRRLMLGTWQGIWFCEFDGPRSRKLWVSVIPTSG